MEVSVNHFRANLKKHVDDCVSSHQVLKVKRKKGEAFVVLSLADWSAVEETLYLNRIPGMVQSIHRASEEALSKGTRLRDLKW